MKIQNAFRLGIFGGLGVLIALLIGGAFASLATILTYIGAAIFIALGLDPLISWLESRKWPRWAAILTVLVGVLGMFAGLVFAIIPVVIEQSNKLITQVTEYVTNPDALDELLAQIQSVIPVEVLDVRAAADDLLTYLTDPDNLTQIGGGVLAVSVSIATGIFGALIILILTLYFTASLGSIKRSLYRLVPRSRREKFIGIAEQVSHAVGRYVVGQVSLALINGVASFIFLTIIGAAYPALFAFIAFLFSLVPLVGTLSGSILIVATQLLVNPESTITVIAAGIWYLAYMQIEAYVLSPNIMNRAVKVPGVVVVIAALIGGTLLGILGALIAIPVAASIIIVINQVVVPKLEER
ncbi:AI-2E family transporter [Microcella sp.]|uniref:AI-2E family transporter n=1 Tax=Microcella sp. TaxID=1913979 RepID=UPI00299F5B6E|nr:AI-2E family transporter [Microcella sp.]MDX2026573.1 AI-2E family transporter [Microcella sp.]